MRRGTGAFEKQSLSESAYLAALAAASDGVLLVNRAGVVAYANPAAETCLADDSLVGQYLTDLSMLDRRTVCTIARELQRARQWKGRIPVRPAGPELDVTVQRVGPNADGCDAPEQLCVVLHGATAATAATAATTAATAARRTESAETPPEHAHSQPPSKLSRFTSEIAHDFNNQIAVILNYTFVLLRHMPADSPLKAHVAEMQAAAWRASQVAQAIHRALST